MTSLQLVQLIVRTLDEKKAQNIEVIQIGDLSILGEYFVIADTDNATHVKSLVEELEFQAKQHGILPRLIEKDSGSSWIVLDYQEVIVHIFHKKTSGKDTIPIPPIFIYLNPFYSVHSASSFISNSI